MNRLHRSRKLDCLVCGLLLMTYGSEAQNGPIAASLAPVVTLSADDTLRQPHQESVTIPAGTHLLMKLISPLHTTSSTPGSGAYLETVFPVTANAHVVIPEHTRVMGEVSTERRPGRTRGRAQLRLQFTQLILPDHRDFAIMGNLQSLPGSRTNRTVDRNGTIEPVDQIDADVYTLAGTTMSGALLGSIARPGLGTGVGALVVGGLGLAKVLFTRGDEISLPVGTRVEMILRRPLTIQGPFSKHSERSESDGQSCPAATTGPCAEPAPSSNVDAPGNRASGPSSLVSDELESNGPSSRIPCLRDGVTLQCVTANSRTSSSHDSNR